MHAGQEDSHRAQVWCKGEADYEEMRGRCIRYLVATNSWGITQNEFRAREAD